MATKKWQVRGLEDTSCIHFKSLKMTKSGNMRNALVYCWGFTQTWGLHWVFNWAVLDPVSWSSLRTQTRT